MRSSPFEVFAVEGDPDWRILPDGQRYKAPRKCPKAYIREAAAQDVANSIVSGRTRQMAKATARVRRAFRAQSETVATRAKMLVEEQERVRCVAGFGDEQHSDESAIVARTVPLFRQSSTQLSSGVRGEVDRTGDASSRPDRVSRRYVSLRRSSDLSR